MIENTEGFKEEFLALSSTITKSNEETVFQIVSWPYSRNILKTLFESATVEYSLNRPDKRFDEFKVNITESSKNKILHLLKRFEQEAKKLGGKSQARNELSDDIQILIEDNKANLKSSVENNNSETEEFFELKNLKRGPKSLKDVNVVLDDNSDDSDDDILEEKPKKTRKLKKSKKEEENLETPADEFEQEDDI